MPDAFDEFVADAEAAMETVRSRAEDFIKERLNTPAPPASKPGEHPHKRTGNLRDGIHVDVTRHGDYIELTVTSNAIYTQYLENSGRPVISDIPDDLAEMVIQQIETELRTPSSPE